MEYTQRKNINRGYRKLRVWQDAIEYYALTCGIFMKFPYELKRIASNHIASVDSIHRNIAEGFCRRSIKEYLLFLNYAYKIENGLKKLIESLQLKQQNKDWDESFIISESNVQYLTEREAGNSSALPVFHSSNPETE
jgi:four helix bundle protein